MPKRKEKHHGPCTATGKVILCGKCIRPANISPKRKVCDYHAALLQFRDENKVGDDNPFDVSRFIDRIEWDKVVYTCEPELTSLFKNIRKTNQALAMRVI